jgi:glycolate oxidase iron-sulfur subunit
MRVTLSSEFKGTAVGADAEAILRKCVHCGFCNATCPTYQLLGDELDGPRGRIYLIKQVLEGAPVTVATQTHLDRCLTCRNCETTCPSGVEYGHLVDIGRELVDARVPRPAAAQASRWTLKEGLTSRWFAPAVHLGRALRPLLPRALRDKLSEDGDPAPAAARGAARRLAPGAVSHPRKVLLLAGCVQPALRPNINAATIRVLDAAGIETRVAPDAGCCGAIRHHLNDQAGGLRDMRRNIDAWWPSIEAGEIEAVVANASGCSVTVKDYGHALRRDPSYAAKALRVGSMTRDLAELLPDIVAALKPRWRPPAGSRLAYHPPCTLQHGMRLGRIVETQLRELGFDLQLAPNESHLCCGSAGTYSVLQPELALRLRDRKLAALATVGAPAIVSANIGCIQHLQGGTAVPVRHWIEVLDAALAAAPAGAAA